uniref:Secreted protein n=1 Tax=Panagrellus redivivus TaxID=6233 RepID=A0A7E4V9X8_PANRE
MMALKQLLIEVIFCAHFFVVISTIIMVTSTATSNFCLLIPKLEDAHAKSSSPSAVALQEGHRLPFEHLLLSPSFPAEPKRKPNIYPL